MANEVLLAAQRLNRHYGAYQALHDVDITLRRGEVLGFLGLNGAGKSTTMKILAGALRPHSGAVEVCGRSLASDPLQTKKDIGYLPETPPLYADVRVDEYIAWRARLRGTPGGAIEAAVARAWPMWPRGRRPPSDQTAIKRVPASRRPSCTGPRC